MAKSLGYRVVGLIDRDPAKSSSTVVTAVVSACDAVVRLPDTMAMERALLAGADPDHLRQASAVLPEFGQPDPTVGKTDAELSHAIMSALHKSGLHEQFLMALFAMSAVVPPVVRDALNQVTIVGATDYSGPTLVDLVYEQSK